MATPPELPAEAKANALHCTLLAIDLLMGVKPDLDPLKRLQPDAWGGASAKVHKRVMKDVDNDLDRAVGTLTELSQSLIDWARMLDAQIAADVHNVQLGRATESGSPFGPLFNPFG